MIEKKLKIFLMFLMVTCTTLLFPIGMNEGFSKLSLDLSDSLNFRLWFVSIALDNVDNEHPLFKTKDCAGFVFYSLKEALKKHDMKWIKKTGYRGPIFEDVKKYNYPNTPLSVNIFFDGKDFVPYVTAYNLLMHNVEFVSFEREHAKVGDLVFFFHPEDPDFPFHVMIYTTNGFVYHTGPGGEIRYVRFEDMMLGDMAWRPIRLNKAFLGYFRLKFLTD
ncbi:hypothetical protein HNP65_001201 [Thermosipho japonicus]|uniref:DUF1175 domain-containing protein n=1 Tax=Thermosipho japonicus TaxID=90323 RepID=A0A841GSJ6_9BACT|nr:DUF1175 family protein [Thermosipho japonicus]MBB6062749.1 hypothetical protein [Thermosipho japonicus]